MFGSQEIMVKYLLGKDIDYAKYDDCISEAKNSLIYAFSWYLDCVASDWDALILNDYEAVMPLPKKLKFCVNYIYQPPWIQQLGIFYKGEINGKLIESFNKSIPRKFKLVDIMFNFDNRITNGNITKRDNFILSLNKSYEELYKGYNTSRKKGIKKAQNLDLNIKLNQEVDVLINLFKENKGSELNKPESDYKALKYLVQRAEEKGSAQVFGVQSKHGKLLGGAIFFIHKNRIIYLFSAVNQEGRKSQVISHILDFLIQKYSENKMILDFEGSMISGIADFFRSFGTYNQPYFYFKRRGF